MLKSGHFLQHFDIRLAIFTGLVSFVGLAGLNNSPSVGGWNFWFRACKSGISGRAVVDRTVETFHGQCFFHFDANKKRFFGQSEGCPIPDDQREIAVTYLSENPSEATAVEPCKELTTLIFMTFAGGLGGAVMGGYGRVIRRKF